MQRRHDEEPEYSITQKAPRGPGRRREEEAEALIWIPPFPPPPLVVEKKCRCPSCNYEIVVEWGTRCLLSVCPQCGHRMRAVSTGEYRISQVEASPVVPLLFGLGFFGLLAYLISKRPFG